MKHKDKQYVIDTIENEGFDYAFAHYSSFEEIKDEKFHAFREKYLAARQELSDYIGVDADAI